MNGHRSMAIVWTAFFLALTIMAVAGIAGIVGIERLDDPVSDPIVISPDTESGTVTSYTNEHDQTVVLNRIVDWENNIVCYLHIVDDTPADPVCMSFTRR